ncbi:hypothetical protein [Corallococcus carmarthensis]|uniref:hypothetical protein n=1 Tax=Corallococcus carmarthensis TaxID=2316728 RepID=UPI00148CF35F|nr:hypothetical protein [Corallococcus carmarthensis]
MHGDLRDDAVEGAPELLAVLVVERFEQALAPVGLVDADLPHHVEALIPEGAPLVLELFDEREHRLQHGDPLPALAGHHQRVHHELGAVEGDDAGGHRVHALQRGQVMRHGHEALRAPLLLGQVLLQVPALQRQDLFELRAGLDGPDDVGTGHGAGA